MNILGSFFKKEVDIIDILKDNNICYDPYKVKIYETALIDEHSVYNLHLNDLRLELTLDCDDITIVRLFTDGRMIVAHKYEGTADEALIVYWNNNYDRVVNLDKLISKL